MNFISSIYLWLLPLISIPLLIYLFNKNKLKNINFSSLIFLHKIKDDSIKKINITNILLLIIRTLIILFFILMMSRPTYNSFYQSGRDIDSLIIIGVDNSISMSLNINRNIKNIIKNTIQPFEDDTEIKIITLGNNEVVYTGEKGDFHESNILKIKKTYKSVNVNSINKVIDTNNRLNTFFFIISDGQSHLVDSPINIPDDENFHLHYIYLNQEKENLSVKELEINKKILVPNDIFKISVTVENNGNIDLENKSIDFIVNDINIGKEFLDIKKNSKKVIEFEASIPDYGEHLCQIKLADDDILEDNIYYFILNIKKSINIDIITNSENIYLENALKSFNINENIINTEHHTLKNYLYKKINTNILFVLGLDNITEELKNKLYASNNFSYFKIIIIPNIDDLNFDSISHFITDFDQVKSNRVTYNDNNYLEIKSENINDYFLSEMYKDFPIRNIKIFDYIDIKSNKNTIIRLENNSSLVSRFFINDNKIELNLLSISFNLNSSNWPLKGSIIPFMQYLIKNEELLEYTDIHKTLKKMKVEKNTNIISPFGNSIIATNKNQNSFLNELGFHKKTIDSENSYLPVNIGEEELLSEYISYANLRDFLDEKITLSDSPKNAAAYINKTIVGNDLWKIFLYLILILIFTEMFLTTIYIKND